FPSSFGPINDSPGGNKDGSMTNINQSGNKYKDARTPRKRIQRITVPTTEDCLCSSACTKLSKNVVGKIITLGDVSINKRICPSNRCFAPVSGLSVYRTCGYAVHFCLEINSSIVLSAIGIPSISISLSLSFTSSIKSLSATSCK